MNNTRDPITRTNKKIHTVRATDYKRKCKLTDKRRCMDFFNLDKLLTKNKKPTNWWGRQNATALKFDPKQSELVFSAVFRTSINADRK